MRYFPAAGTASDAAGAWKSLLGTIAVILAPSITTERFGSNRPDSTSTTVTSKKTIGFEGSSARPEANISRTHAYNMTLIRLFSSVKVKELEVSPIVSTIWMKDLPKSLSHYPK